MAGGWEYGPTGHTAVDPTTGQFYQLTYDYDVLGNLKSWGWRPVSVTAPTPAPAAVAASTGVNPTETTYSLYGHNIPLSVFGVGRIGGDIISGSIPFISNGAATFIISFGVPADPGGTRTLREIAFDSEVVWTLADGFFTEPFTFRFYGGSLTQPADPIEIAQFGAEANAYRPQILLAFDNLPLANTKFKKIPYVAALIADSTGDDVLFSEAWERLAYSPWVGYTSAEFETVGLTDSLPNGGMIFVEQAEFLATIQQFGRFYSTWDILQTDKLRIVDRSDVVADITLNKDRLIDIATVTRQGEDTVRKDLELSTIANDADYTIVPSTAQRPRDPVEVTTSVGKDTAYLPIITDAFTRQAIVTFARYHEEQARKTITGTAMGYGLEIEPGALIALRLGGDFNNETFKVGETLHGNNYTVEFTATAILKCDIGDPATDPYWGYVVLLVGFGGADASMVITDESPRHHGTATVLGSAQIDTAQFKYGTTSGYFPHAHPFPGTGDNMFWPASADWDLGTVWTIECFVRFNGTAADQTLISQWIGVFDAGFMIRTIASQALEFFAYNYDNTTNIDITTAASAFTTGIWYHIAVDSNGTKVRFYRNGVMVGSATPGALTTRCGNYAQPIKIGGDGGAGSGSRDLNGYLDEVRVTKNICRYGSDSGFTVPTEAFPRF